jgi:hypothetical protein
MAEPPKFNILPNQLTPGVSLEDPTIPIDAYEVNPDAVVRQIVTSKLKPDQFRDVKKSQAVILFAYTTDFASNPLYSLLKTSLGVGQPGQDAKFVCMTRFHDAWIPNPLMFKPGVDVTKYIEKFGVFTIKAIDPDQRGRENLDKLNPGDLVEVEFEGSSKKHGFITKLIQKNMDQAPPSIIQTLRGLFTNPIEPVTTGPSYPIPDGIFDADAPIPAELGECTPVNTGGISSTYEAGASVFDPDQPLGSLARARNLPCCSLVAAWALSIKGYNPGGDYLNFPEAWSALSPSFWSKANIYTPGNSAWASIEAVVGLVGGSICVKPAGEIPELAPGRWHAVQRWKGNSGHTYLVWYPDSPVEQTVKIESSIAQGFRTTTGPWGETMDYTVGVATLDSF